MTGFQKPTRQRGVRHPRNARVAQVVVLSKPAVDQAHEDAVVALCTAFEHILKPWFDGDARLNYAALRELFLMSSRLRRQVSATITNPLAALDSAVRPKESPNASE